MPDRTDTEMSEDIQRTALQGAVTSAIERMQERLASGEFKMTIAEFTRLLDLQRELSAENIRHVKVTWVDPFNKTEPVTET